jgi:hypothetical protein
VQNHRNNQVAAMPTDSSEDASPRKRQWVCPNCGETLESSFDTCWSCGTSQSGATASVEFEAKKMRNPVAEPEPTPVIGYTLDHDPIYQVGGITADGKVVPIGRVAEWTTDAGNGQSQLAIAAFGFAFAFPPVGIILGHLARADIRHTGEQGAGLALFALIWSYLAVAFIVITLLTL